MVDSRETGNGRRGTQCAVCPTVPLSYCATVSPCHCLTVPLSHRDHRLRGGQGGVRPATP